MIPFQTRQTPAPGTPEDKAKKRDDAAFVAAKFAALERMAIDPKATEIAFRILLRFACHHMRWEGHYRANPSQGTLAELFGCSADTVARGLTMLLSGGYIVDDGTRGKTKAYRLNMAIAQAGEPTTSRKSAVGSASTCRKSAVGRDNQPPANLRGDIPQICGVTSRKFAERNPLYETHYLKPVISSGSKNPQSDAREPEAPIGCMKVGSKARLRREAAARVGTVLPAEPIASAMGSTEASPSIEAQPAAPVEPEVVEVAFEEVTAGDHGDLLGDPMPKPDAKPSRATGASKAAETRRKQAEMRDMLAKFAADYPPGDNTPARDNPDGWWSCRIPLARALKSTEPEAIFAGAKAYAAQVAAKGTEPRFVKSPFKWLDEGKWRDALAQAETAKTQPQRPARQSYGAPATSLDRFNTTAAQIDRQMAEYAQRHAPKF